MKAEVKQSVRLFWFRSVFNWRTEPKWKLSEKWGFRIEPHCNYRWIELLPMLCQIVVNVERNCCLCWARSFSTLTKLLAMFRKLPLMLSQIFGSMESNCCECWAKLLPMWSQVVANVESDHFPRWAKPRVETKSHVEPMWSQIVANVEPNRC